MGFHFGVYFPGILIDEFVPPASEGAKGLVVVKGDNEFVEEVSNQVIPFYFTISFYSLAIALVEASRFCAD